MYRIRIHARGGQGAKTASRILGSALFAEGYEVQDAPQYGAERRGAPIRATVRAAHAPILERGEIERPDLVLIADETLIPVAAAGVLAGLGDRTVLLIRSEEDAETWRYRLGLSGPILTLGLRVGAEPEIRFVGARCAGAVARMLGVISRESLEGALRRELAALDPAAVEENLDLALEAYDAFTPHEGCVTEAPEPPLPTPAESDWVDLPVVAASIAAPDIHGGPTSVRVRTGLWRTVRPVIDLDRCHHCHWVCSTLCPDGAIEVLADGAPQIDYDHCKGCMICVAVCPTHAIDGIPEARARREEEVLL